MPPKKEAQDPRIDAVQRVYEALLPLSDELRDRVISSVRALFGGVEPAGSGGLKPALALPRSAASSVGRPTSVVELIKDKGPKTNIDYIVLFAYYRDQVEGNARFSRNDLKDYWA